MYSPVAVFCLPERHCSNPHVYAHHPKTSEARRPFYMRENLPEVTPVLLKMAALDTKHYCRERLPTRTWRRDVKLMHAT